MSGALLANLGLLYAILVGVNIPAPFLGLDFGDSERRLAYEPPVYVIPLAWFVLFGLLGVARYEVTRLDPRAVTRWLIVALAVLCATYAYYTLGLAKLTGVSALWCGLGGNLLVIAAALAVACAAGRDSAAAGVLVLPVAVWTAYATAIVIGQMRTNGLI